jgi:serine/threonine-protein kinase
VLVVAATLGGALGLIRHRASQAADAAIDRGLGATQSAIEDALAGRSRSLQQTARVLGQVPTYISYVEQALQASDRSSLIAQARELNSQSGAAWTLIVDHEGMLQASTRSPDAFGDDMGGSALVDSALSGVPNSGIWVESTPAGDSLFQAVAVPLAAPHAPVAGALIMAAAIDGAFADRLKRQTASEVVFVVFDTLGVPRVAASTLPPGTLDSALRVRYPSTGAAPAAVQSRLRVEAGGLTWIAAAGPLTTASGAIVGEYAGLRAREAELAPFTALQRSILVAFVAALAIALVISLVLAGQITSPVRQLVALTRDVAEGRYSGSINLRSRDEIGELAEAFQRMVGELREKQKLVEFLGGSGARTLRVPAGGSATTVPSAARLGPGSVLANRYEIRQQLGAGGMGVVYRAFDRELQESVAIKTLRPELLGDPVLLERFKQEIRLARRISHPNVVRTHDLGEADGQYFITMEFVEGTSLEELIARRGALPLNVTLTIGRQLCRALEVAHGQGVVHRDIKPQNLVLDSQGFLKVMDFGIARLVEGRRPPGPGLTADGSIIGTPEYMAPEQLMGQPVDGRADLYAAGCLLFECATGRRLFAGDSFATILMKQVQEPPPDPRTVVPGLPEAFAALVLKALAKQPGDRWQSAAELHQALDQVQV